MKYEKVMVAMRPFAEIAGEGSEDFADDTPVTVKFGRTTHYSLTLGDLRRIQGVFVDLLFSETHATKNATPD